MTPRVDLNDLVASVKSQRAPGNYFTMGLVIRKKGTDYPGITDIRDTLPEHSFLEVDTETDSENITSFFKNALEGKTWILIYLAEGTLPRLLLEQLLRLKNTNTVLIQGKNMEETFFGRQSAETRVMVVIDEENIAKVDYPGFLSIFGPIVDL